MLPIIGVVGALPFNFAGFTGGIENFYEVQGPLSALGDGTIFVIANLLFWTGWINVQLGFSTAFRRSRSTAGTSSGRALKQSSRDSRSRRLAEWFAS